MANNRDLDLRNASSTGEQPSVFRIDDAPETYSRLLTEYIALLKTLEFDPYISFTRSLILAFNPRFYQRLLRSSYLRDFIRVPDALRQELPYAERILISVQALDEARLRALARCSAINVGKLSARVLFGGVNKWIVGLAAILTALKAFKEVFGIDTAGYVPFLKEFLAPALIGFAVGVVFNLLVWYQRLRLVRALDEIISIAVAAKNQKQ